MAKTPKPIVTKIVVGDYVGDIYPVQNLVPIGLVFFAPPHMCEVALESDSATFY